jgi:glycosyltransferase involved in cell wall biosynthesis
MPSPSDVLVSICLPVRNGGARLPAVVGSVLAQDHTNVELVISDNASTDDTEDVARSLAATDERIVYVRQPTNIGLLNNFISAMHRTRGQFFRWISYDDWIAPTCISRCLLEFLADDRLVLVTMGVEFEHNDGTVKTADYTGRALSSDDPLERFEEMLRLLNESYLLIDPLYGLMRRATVVPIQRRNMLREDEVFATKLALAGPWGHVREVLGRRGYTADSRRDLARRLGVPAWTAHAATTLQRQEFMRFVSGADLLPRQRSQARAAVRHWYITRQRRDTSRRALRLAQLARLAPRR